MATYLERHIALDKSRLLEYALSYARHGWRVVPLYERLPDGSCACAQPGCAVVPHPRVPIITCATTDEEQIRRWWRLAPRAGIGVVITSRDGSETIIPIPGTVDHIP